MKNLAIIPARSGSKGLKDKNIKLMNGLPLLAYSIKAALNSKLFDEVMVSTDSKEYSVIAKKYGASVPFLRSQQNSTDNANSWDTVKEVLLKYKKEGINFDTVTLLQPTSPLRKAEDIVKAFNLFNKNIAVSVISVCEVDHSPIWSNILPKNLSMKDFISRNYLGVRQELPKYYRLNGAIYIVRVNELFEDSYLYREGSYAYKMPKNRSIDIDTEEDFLLAEYLMKKEGNRC